MNHGLGMDGVLSGHRVEDFSTLNRYCAPYAHLRGRSYRRVFLRTLFATCSGNQWCHRDLDWKTVGKIRLWEALLCAGSRQTMEPERDHGRQNVYGRTRSGRMGQ